jgi:hypothetical protein
MVPGKEITVIKGKQKDNFDKDNGLQQISKN